MARVAAMAVRDAGAWSLLMENDWRRLIRVKGAFGGFATKAELYEDIEERHSTEKATLARGEPLYSGTDPRTHYSAEKRRNNLSILPVVPVDDFSRAPTNDSTALRRGTSLDEGAASTVEFPDIAYEIDNFVLYTISELFSVTMLPIDIDGKSTGELTPPKKVVLEGNVGPENRRLKKTVRMWKLILTGTSGKAIFLVRTAEGDWIKLLKPADAYLQHMSNAAALAAFLQFVKNHPEASKNAVENYLDQLWCRSHRNDTFQDLIAQNLTTIRCYAEGDANFEGAAVLRDLLPDLDEHTSSQRDDYGDWLKSKGKQGLGDTKRKLGCDEDYGDRCDDDYGDHLKSKGEQGLGGTKRKRGSERLRLLVKSQTSTKMKKMKKKKKLGKRPRRTEYGSDHEQNRSRKARSYKHSDYSAYRLRGRGRGRGRAEHGRTRKAREIEEERESPEMEELGTRNCLQIKLYSKGEREAEKEAETEAESEAEAEAESESESGGEAGYSEDPPICTFCDDGGDLLFCEGPCRRHFHPTVASGRESNCGSLGLTTSELKRVVVFYCKNCRGCKQQCFVCGVLGTSVPTATGPPEVQRCDVPFCKRFYHVECVAEVLASEDTSWQRGFIEGVLQGRQKLICPRHRCAVCLGSEKKEPGKLVQCRRCPTGWHRACLENFEASGELKSTNVWRHYDREFIYCKYHKIVPELMTPAKDHVKFP